MLDTKSRTDFMPEAALVPAEMLNARCESLIDLVASQMTRGQMDMFLPGRLRSVARLLAFHGDLTGIARMSAGQPILCHLAFCLAPDTLDGTAFIANLAAALRSKAVGSAFPELTAKPRKQRDPARPELIVNPLLIFHLELAETPAYSLLAARIQHGLIQLLSIHGWPMEYNKDISAILTGPRRIIKAVPEEMLHEFQFAVESGNIPALEMLVGSVLARMKRERGNQNEPIKRHTLRAFSDNFFKLLFKFDEISLPQRRDAFIPRSSQKMFDIDDDLPEDANPPDRFRIEHIAQVEQEVARELHPGKQLDSVLLEIEERQDDLRYYGDEHAVMGEYLDRYGIRIVQPHMLAEIFQYCLTEIDDLELRTLILAIALTGRSLKWLLSIVVSDEINLDGQLTTPQYIPKRDMLIFSPEVLAQLPKGAERTDDLFVPTNANSAFSIPEILLLDFRTLAERRDVGGRLFSVRAKGVRDVLEAWSQVYQAHMPSEPEITESRLRLTFNTLITVISGLDPLLSAMISGQWRFSLRAPLHYTTIPLTLLANRYRTAVRKLWGACRACEPGLPKWPERPAAILPRGFQGSPYMPKRAIMRRVVATLAETSRDPSETQETRHNAQTLLALYLLACLCGLRISSTGNLKTWYFDFQAVWGDTSMPWLALPKTRGNRFTSSSRLIPLPGTMLPLLDKLVTGRHQDHPFHFLKGGEKLPATGYQIMAHLDNLELPYPRWHAGRHLLRTYLLEQGYGFDATNAILGHQSAGREQFNPYLPVDVLDDWLTYCDLADRLARSLGWDGRVIDA